MFDQRGRMKMHIPRSLSRARDIPTTDYSTNPLRLTQPEVDRIWQINRCSTRSGGVCLRAVQRAFRKLAKHNQAIGCSTEIVRGRNLFLRNVETCLIYAPTVWWTRPSLVESVKGLRRDDATIASCDRLTAGSEIKVRVVTPTRLSNLPTSLE